MPRIALLLALFLSPLGCGDSTLGPEAGSLESQFRSTAAGGTTTIAPIDHSAKILTGQVVSVADGDTLTVLDATKTQHKSRLQGIDAPERRQAFGAKSRQALADKVFRKSVRVEWKERDRYGRIIGEVYVGNRWINKEMVEEGWAWHYKRYSDSRELAQAEEQSRAAKRGLWADPNPIPPWEFRRSNEPTSTGR